MEHEDTSETRVQRGSQQRTQRRTWPFLQFPAWSLDSGPLVCAASTLFTGHFPRLTWLCVGTTRNRQSCAESTGWWGQGGEGWKSMSPWHRCLLWGQLRWQKDHNDGYTRVNIPGNTRLWSLNGWFTWYLNSILNHYKKNPCYLENLYVQDA